MDSSEFYATILASVIASIITSILTTIVGYLLGIINNKRRKQISTLKKFIDFLSKYQAMKITDVNRRQFANELSDLRNLIISNFPEPFRNKKQISKEVKNYLKGDIKKENCNKTKKEEESKWLFDDFQFVESNIYAQLRTNQDFYLTEKMWLDEDKNIKNVFYLKYYKMLHPFRSLFLRKRTLIDSYKFS